MSTRRQARREANINDAADFAVRSIVRGREVQVGELVNLAQYDKWTAIAVGRKYNVATAIVRTDTVAYETTKEEKTELGTQTITLERQGTVPLGYFAAANPHGAVEVLRHRGIRTFSDDPSGYTIGDRARETVNWQRRLSGMRVSEGVFMGITFGALTDLVATWGVSKNIATNDIAISLGSLVTAGALTLGAVNVARIRLYRSLLRKTDKKEPEMASTD